MIDLGFLVTQSSILILIFQRKVLYEYYYCHVVLGGGGDMSIFDYSPRKWAKTHTQKLFLRNGKIIYYQDVLQLPVPLTS